VSAIVWKIIHSGCVYLVSDCYVHEAVDARTTQNEKLYDSQFPDWPPGARTANGTALCH
jgi:hypothetical protein